MSWHPHALLKEALKFIDFSLVGIGSFLINLLVTVFLTEYVGLKYYVSNIIALALAWTFNFFVNEKLTFHVSKGLKDYGAKFAVVATMSSLMHAVFILGLVEIFDTNYIVAIIIVSIVMSAATFISEDLWVFKKK